MTNITLEAKAMESDERFPEAIQLYDEILTTDADPESLAFANYRLGMIYREWNELFAAQRFLSQAHYLNSDNSEIQKGLDSLNAHFSENRELVSDQMSRQNSDQIVSLFRIATGIKLISMDKSVQAYPLLKSRTKIYPNASVAKHLLTDISITEEERNSAIEFLLERNWLENSGVDLYSISIQGLYKFYSTLGKLHIENSDYSEGLICFDQAYRLDKTHEAPIYNKVICYSNLNEWDQSISLIQELSESIPVDIDSLEYLSAVAHSYHNRYQMSRDETDKQQVVKTCQMLLQIDKKQKAISELLDSYQDKKPWWRI
ncbi:hypothetical protein C6497_10600 [Candidatus Poribacteria bacterium]|nr:MAG: hypothetical protein C6497_10600 [Candidatus Poribacteria bacterium]